MRFLFVVLGLSLVYSAGLWFSVCGFGLCWISELSAL